MHPSILGVWALRSFVVENMDAGTRVEPFGASPRGTLILHPGGRMAALIMPGDDGVSAREGDSQRLVAYAGRYRLEPPDRFVTAVDVAWLPAWIGTDQARMYQLDGDQLAVFTGPGPMMQPDGHEATVRGTLSWTREADTPIEP